MFGQFDKRLKLFIPDFRLNLIVSGEMEKFNQFHTELGSVLEAIKVSADKDSVNRLFQGDEKFLAMSNELVEAINIFIGTNISTNQKKWVTNMCKAWEDMMNEMLTEGCAEGRTKERRNTISKMLSKNRTPEGIADLCGYDFAEVKGVEKELLMLA